MHAISDDELEFQVNDRISFMGFLGLGIEDPIPDAKTVWLFRDNLTKHDLVKQVFSYFDDYLREKGYVVKGGQIVDAALIAILAKKTKKSRQDYSQKVTKDSSPANPRRVSSPTSIWDGRV